MTKQQLHDLIDQYIVENTQGRITATQLNTILSNTVDALKAMQESVTPAESIVPGSVEGQYVEQVTQSSEGVISVTRKKLPAEVFIATYGTTTFQEVTTAFNAGKLILCIIDEDPDFYACRLSYYDNEGEDGRAEFDSIDHNGNVVGAILYGNDSWDTEHTAFQQSLQSGVNIKTINNNSIVGPGNLSVPCGKKVSWVGNKYLTISAGSVIGPGLRFDIEYESYGVGSFIIYSKGTSVEAYYYGADYISKIDNIALYRDTDNNTKYVIEATSTPSGWNTFTFLFNGNEPVINTESDISTWTHLYDASVTILQNELISGTTIKTINNTSLLGSGNIDTNNVFVAVYGTTTVAEIETAIAANKVVICYRNDVFYRLSYRNYNYYYFAASAASGTYFLKLSRDGNNTWSTLTSVFETTLNKVTTISSSSTNDQYPSAKCVYDIVGDIETLLASI